MVVAVPEEPDELDPQAARVVQAEGSDQGNGRASGRTVGAHGEDFRSGRAGVEVPQGKPSHCNPHPCARFTAH